MIRLVSGNIQHTCGSSSLPSKQSSSPSQIQFACMQRQFLHWNSSSPHRLCSSWPAESKVKKNSNNSKITFPSPTYFIFVLLTNFIIKLIERTYQSTWHYFCPGAGCRHTRTLGLPGRPNRGYRNRHNSPGRHCHLKNKHRTKQQISTNLPSQRDCRLCVHPFMAFSNVSPWSGEHKVLLHCPLRTNFLLSGDVAAIRGHYF